MKVTMRDLFNHINPACTYSRFIKEHKLDFDDMPEELHLKLYPNAYPQRVSRVILIDRKRYGGLAGEQWAGKANDKEYSDG